RDLSPCVILSPLPWEACLSCCPAVDRRGICTCPRPPWTRLRPSNMMGITPPTRIPSTTNFRPSELHHESFPIPTRRAVCRERTGQPDCQPIRQPLLYLLPRRPGRALPGLSRSSGRLSPSGLFRRQIQLQPGGSERIGPPGRGF